MSRYGVFSENHDKARIASHNDDMSVYVCPPQVDLVACLTVVPADCQNVLVFTMLFDLNSMICQGKSSI